MAVTLHTNTPYPEGFAACANSADWTNAEVVVAAVTGQSHYIERLTLISGIAGVNTFTIGAGEAASAVETLMFTISMTSGAISIPFSRPLKCAEGKEIVMDCDAAGSATLIVEGFTT